MSDKLNSRHIFEVLARQQVSMLMAYLLSLVADYAPAEDVAQQTFLIACRKINTLNDPAPSSPNDRWIPGRASETLE